MNQNTLFLRHHSTISDGLFSSSKYYISDVSFNILRNRTVARKRVSGLALVLIVFICVTPVIAMPILRQIPQEDIAQTSNEELPDLVIEQFVVSHHGDYPHYPGSIEAVIKNVGNVSTEFTEFSVWYWIGRLISLGQVGPSGTNGLMYTTLRPGDWAGVPLISERDTPKFGIFIIKAVVNPERTIQESNYDNNKYWHLAKVFFGRWTILN